MVALTLKPAARRRAAWTRRGEARLPDDARTGGPAAQARFSGVAAASRSAAPRRSGAGTICTSTAAQAVTRTVLPARFGNETRKTDTPAASGASLHFCTLNSAPFGFIRIMVADDELQKSQSGKGADLAHCSPRQPAVILANGLHCGNSPVKAPDWINIGNPELISKRASHPVPQAPGGVLNDYIPFYSPLFRQCCTTFARVGAVSRSGLMRMS